MAGMTNTEPPTTIPAVAPIVTTLTFSRMVERRFSIGSAEKPMARMAIGMADSIPCPSFKAT
jgi:hypothetical protein